MYNISIDLQKVSFNLSSRSISSIGKMVEIVRIHNQSYLEFRQIQKFNKFKPFTPSVAEAIANPNSLNKREVCLKWFKFAGDMALRSLRSTNLGIDLFKISNQKEMDYMSEFKVIYYRFKNEESLDQY